MERASLSASLLCLYECVCVCVFVDPLTKQAQITVLKYCTAILCIANRTVPCVWHLSCDRNGACAYGLFDWSLIPPSHRLHVPAFQRQPCTSLRLPSCNIQDSVVKVCAFNRDILHV